MNENISLVVFSSLWLFCIFYLNKKIRKNGAINRIDNNNVSKRKMTILPIMLCTFFIGFREIGDGIGGSDSLGYVREFLNIKTNYKTDISEVLFKTYLLGLRTITDEWRVLIVLNTLFMSFALLYFLTSFYDRNGYVCTSFVIWPVFLYYSCCAMRNGLSISFCLLSTVALHKKKNKLAIILSVIGLLFHYSAIFYVGYVFIYIVFITKTERRIFSKRISIVLLAIMIIVAFPFYDHIYQESRYAFFQRQISASFLGFAPFYIIGIVAYWKHKSIIRRYGNMEILFGTYYLCVIIPICIYFGIYRVPYFFMGHLAIASSNAIETIYGENISKSYASYTFYSRAVFIIFMLYGVLKTLTIASDSGILQYKLL